MLQAQQSTVAIVVFDIDGVIRDVTHSYRRAIADTVEQFTAGAFRPTLTDIDRLKAEGIWNNDWEASRELIYRYFEQQGRSRASLELDYEQLVTFFQRRYRGPEPSAQDWSGYICQEPLLLTLDYLNQLTQAGMPWGFFSGATRGSALFVLEHRLGLRSPILVAMEDAPGKPDPIGLVKTVQQIEHHHTVSSSVPVIYVGDTVADMQTALNAQTQAAHRRWLGIGILPPHAQTISDYADAYTARLHQAGATRVFTQVTQLTPEQILTLL